MGQWAIDKTLGAHTEGNGSPWNSLKSFKGGQSKLVVGTEHGKGEDLECLSIVFVADWNLQ